MAYSIYCQSMDDFTKEVNQRTLSNCNNRDKALITISTAVIAGTATFLQSDEVGLEIWLLFVSWVFFLVTVVSVVKSFDASNEAHEALLSVHNYYTGLNNGNPPETNTEDKLNEVYEKSDHKMKRLDSIAGRAFLSGLIMLMVFGIVKLGDLSW